MNNPRVRIMALVVGALAAVYLLDQVILGPLLSRWDRVDKALANVQGDLNKVNAELATEKALRAKITGVRAELAKRDEAKVQGQLVKILDGIGRSSLKANIRNSPESKKTDNFSEVTFTFDGEGPIESVSRLLYELTYFKDYFKIRKPTFTSRESGKVQFSFTGSALMSKSPGSAAGASGLAHPDKPALQKFKPIGEKNIFAPHESAVPVSKRPEKKHDPRKVDVRMSSIVAGSDGPEALLESQGKYTWVKKGDKYGKYTVVEVRKQSAQSSAGARDEVVLSRGKSQVTLKLDETGRLLHDDESDDEDAPSK